MTANWISDGSEATQDNPPMAAPPRWRIGRYTFEHWPRAETGPGSLGRWGCNFGNMHGVGGHRSPVGAFFACRRFARAQRPAGVS
jgi:hypothetical protein